MIIFQVRKAVSSDISGIAKVQVDSYQTSYKNLLPEDFLANFTYADQQSDWVLWFEENPEDILLVAVDHENTVIGYALNRIIDSSNNTGEVVALHVLPWLKMNGIGKKLFIHSCRHLKELGCKSILLWTLINNPSRGFYERLNGDLVGEKDWIIEELTFQTKEVCYRWENIEDVLSVESNDDAK